MTRPPVFSAAWCRTIEVGIPAGFGAATKTDIAKLSAEADVASVVLISLPEFVDSKSNSMDASRPWNEGSELVIDGEGARERIVATSGTYRLALIAVVERHTAVGAEFHISPFGGIGLVV
jgi:hypothetical protein